MTTKLTQSKAWQACQAHYATLRNQRIIDLFTPERAQTFCLEACGIYLDYAKNHITPETLNLLIELAQSQQLAVKIHALINGDIINQSEQRPALHMACRQSYSANLTYKEQPVPVLVQNELDNMFEFAEQIHSGQWRGANGNVITDIINIGIGGSHLGPKMVTRALSDFAVSDLNCHFIANIDAAEIQELLASLNPDTSLFILSSKSFTTLETLQNAETIKAWLGPERLSQHFVAITAYPEKAEQFGIPAQNVFRIWDFIGGRYSLWSATGLPIVLAIGKENFLALLQGAKQMDEHFVQTPFTENMPVILGLLSIWYINFFHTTTQAILPYSHHLRDLPAHLQQLDMESCGKSVTQGGELVDYHTGSIIWGEAGTIGQHSFHQLLHQGTYYMPIDFILPIETHPDLAEHQAILIASCLSQSQSLLTGNPNETAQHKLIPGNKPSNTILLNGLNPQTLGALIALYEHKVFVQCMIWDINPFDQFGVELGKQITQDILAVLNKSNSKLPLDPSTEQCLVQIKKLLNNK